MRPPLWMRQTPAAIVILSYLGAIAWFTGLQIIGDSPRGPLSYFFTWDMFPNYEMESVRRVVVAEAADGSYVQLLPGDGDRFRWGNAGDATRFDLDRRDNLIDRAVRDAVERDLRDHSEAPPLRRVYLTERYWPARRNAPFRGVLGPPAAMDKPYHWRVVAQADVASDGTIRWKPGP